MNKNITRLFISSFFTLSFSINTFAETSTPCPDVANGETNLDCPWAYSARKMAQDNQTEKDIVKEIKSDLPKITSPVWKDMWGSSINFDENAKGIIVNPLIIKGMEDIFELSENQKAKMVNNRQIVHAGMEHTYSYLFSNLKTPYGYKRDRWVSGEINRGFNFKENIISPNPDDGTLFTNVTYFFGHIAFRNEPDRIKELEKYKNSAAKSLHNYDFTKLNIKRLEEVINLKDQNGKDRTVTLNTDFVEFPSPQKDSHALIYSVYDSTKNSTQLITVFPVEKSFAERAFNPSKLGKNQPIISRYNGYIDGVTFVDGLKGERKISNIDFVKY